MPTRPSLRAKLLSALLVVNLAFQQFLLLVVPFLPTPAYAIEEPVTIKEPIEFAADTNSFTFPATDDQTVDYLLGYYADEKVEVVLGSDQPIYAGTCSTDGDCVDHEVLHGILKTQVKDQDGVRTVRFIMDEVEAEVVLEADDTTLELSQDDLGWLNSSPALPSPDPTPLPTPSSEPDSVLGDQVDTTNPSPSPELTETDSSPPVLGATTVLVDEPLLGDFDLDSQDESTSAQLTTDKPDYAPTEMVVISGSGFEANQAYTIIVSSSDEPAISHTGSVTADDNGYFTYTYQLDGTYRPNYLVEAFDASGSLITSVTFTDAPVSGTTTDSDGANDEPGQKDLTQMSVDYALLPTSFDINWNWDEIKWTGSNTGDACALFDANGNGLTDAALCVTISGNPATDQDTRLFSCGDTRSDRCTSAVEDLTLSSVCSAGTSTDDPFLSGDEYPKDTKAQCVVDPSDVSGAILLDVCSYPSTNPNSDPSDCVIFQSSTGKLEIVKVLDPAEDTGLFNLQIDGVDIVTDVGDGGTTGEQVLDDDTYAIGETAGTDTSLSNYSSSIECRDLNGTGDIVASSNDTGPLDVVLAVDDDIVCTITNTLQNGHLIVQKTTIPGGDQTEFTINATGDGTITGGGAGTITDENDHDYEVTAGTYSVTETVPDGWSETAKNCTDVVVAACETEYCQIENTKLSSISGYKFEDIDGVLGTSEDRNALEGWLIELYVWEAEGWLDTGQSDTTDSSGYYEFSNLLPGLYQVLETLQVGWTNVSSLSQDVDLEAGENSEENDFINTEYVSITVHKDWDYDGDGEAEIFDKTDWTWDISGEDQDVATGSTIDDLLPGSYTISEDQKPTWHVIDLSCSVNGGDLLSYGVNESQEFVLGSGDNLDCTFVNARDRGNITGYKYNDLDGDGIVPEDGELGLEGWTIQAGVDESVEGSDITDANGYFEIANLITGLYTVCEVQQDDWNQTYPANDACHDVNLTTEGASVNFGNQGQGTITVHKNVDENGDGDLDDSEDVLGATNWLFELNTNDYAMGTTVPVAAGTYALSEFDQTGYHFVSLFCDDQQIDGDTADLVVGAGDDVVCTYTNARDTGTITVVKNIDWDESGQIGDHDNDVLGSTSWTWDIASGEQDIATGDSRSMVTDTYTINEDLQANYHLVGWTCDNDTSGDTNSIEVDLGSDDDITCTLTNAPDTGSIQGRKYHDLNGNGDFDQDEKTDANRLDDWTITLYDTDWNVVDSMETGDDGTVAGDVGVGQYLFVDVVPGNYYLCETPQDGWTQTEPSSGIQHTNETYCHEITIDPGEDINTIQFGNERDTGSILITKLIDADGDLQTTEDQFPGENWEMSVNGVSEDTSSPGSQNTDTNGETTFTPLNTGEYDVSETLQDGYDLLDAYCDEENGSLDDETLYGVEVGKDETVSCTFINTPNGTIHGYKWHDTDGDGVQNEFTGYLSGWTINLYQQNGENYDLINSMITDDTTHFGWYWFEHLFPGSYRVCEEPQTGWVQTFPTSESQCFDLTLPDDNSSGFPEQINAVGGPTYNFGNQEQSTVIVTKYLDENGNGDQDENEPNLPDWEIFLSQLSQLTDENGQATFQYITPGEYVLSETIQEGYEQTEISCADGGQTQIDPPSLDDLQVLQTNNELFLEVEPGDELECRIGNHPITPILTLTKSNDALTDQSPGDDVTFTLAITATQSAAYDVVIKDLPAGGFSYQGGTWTAASDIHGPLAIPEPVYASPGQWQLGDMEQDETITLTYLANINNSQEPGLYQDLAWAQGEDVIGGQTLANLSDDPLYFVGTEVNVVSEEQDPVDVSPQGEVLGASTELPATGAQAIWILIGSILILAGLSGITLALKLKRNYVS